MTSATLTTMRWRAPICGSPDPFGCVRRDAVVQDRSVRNVIRFQTSCPAATPRNRTRAHVFARHPQHHADRRRVFKATSWLSLIAIRDNVQPATVARFVMHAVWRAGALSTRKRRRRPARHRCEPGLFEGRIVAGRFISNPVQEQLDPSSAPRLRHQPAHPRRARSAGRIPSVGYDKRTTVPASGFSISIDGRGSRYRNPVKTLRIRASYLSASRFRTTSSRMAGVDAQNVRGWRASTQRITTSQNRTSRRKRRLSTAIRKRRRRRLARWATAGTSGVVARHDLDWRA